jgi:hypothetical protein
MYLVWQKTLSFFQIGLFSDITKRTGCIFVLSENIELEDENMTTLSEREPINRAEHRESTALEIKNYTA